MDGEKGYEELANSKELRDREQGLTPFNVLADVQISIDGRPAIWLIEFTFPGTNRKWLLPVIFTSFHDANVYLRDNPVDIGREKAEILQYVPVPF